MPSDPALVGLLRDLVAIDSVNPSLVPGATGLFSSGFSTEQLALQEFPQVRGFLPKPYRAEQLVQKVVEILGQVRRASQQ